METCKKGKQKPMRHNKIHLGYIFTYSAIRISNIKANERTR